MADRQRGELLKHGQYLSVNEAILRSAELLERVDTHPALKPDLTAGEKIQLGIGYALLALAEATWRGSNNG